MTTCASTPHLADALWCVPRMAVQGGSNNAAAGASGWAGRWRQVHRVVGVKRWVGKCRACPEASKAGSSKLLQPIHSPSQQSSNHTLQGSCSAMLSAAEVAPNICLPASLLFCTCPHGMSAPGLLATASWDGRLCYWDPRSPAHAGPVLAVMLPGKAYSLTAINSHIVVGTSGRHLVIFNLNQ